MKTKIFALFTLSATLVASLTGCIATVDGHTKATALPFSKDKLVSRYEFSVEKVYAAARQTLKDAGTIQAENTINHSYVAKVNERTVWIMVEEVIPTISQVTVQVRKRSGAADLDVAAEIDKVIALNLR